MNEIIKNFNWKRMFDLYFSNANSGVIESLENNGFRKNSI